MPEGRPAIPTPLKRAVMEEAGYRCAVPECKGTAALELAHIVPWAEVREHTFENLILLCAVDHTRYDRGEIPRRSIQVFKQNLALLRGRYSDAERRILEAFAAEPEAAPDAGFPIQGGGQYILMYLLKDGLVTMAPTPGITINGLPPYEIVLLTDKGREVVARMRSAALIDEDIE
jgi:hypothetical protein